MKAKIISVLLVFLLSISITGCSSIKNGSNLNSSSGTGSNKTSDTTVPTTPSSTSSSSESQNTNTQIPSADSVLDSYKAVLQNKAEFFSTDNKRNLYLNDFLTNKEIYGTTFELTHFTVIDMDGDKVPEVVLELSVDNSPFGYEILHYMNNTVYGYNIVYRGLESLKADGTFLYSNGAADSGYGKMKFKSDSYEMDILGYSESSQNNDDMTISYFINNKPVTKGSYDSFVKAQNEKKDVTWYDFTQKNIETELSKNS